VNAAPGTYPSNTKVRYRDDHDNSKVSDIFTANVTVTQRPAPSPLVTILGIAAVIAVIAGAGYYVYGMRKKR